ncbi:MAG: patatin-like phospholipase family protein [Pseudomonadota bacterium]|jgi:predicted acylesterase/phospholipase RssA
MRRRPQQEDQRALRYHRSLKPIQSDLGIVLSGGGVRAAYQAGALKALAQFLEKDLDQSSVVIGSSIGAINGLVFSACLKGGASHAIGTLEEMWRERNFNNTFSGSRAKAFLRALRIAAKQYMDPGPHSSNLAVFDPEPLRERIDRELVSNGGLTPDARAPNLKAVGVMTTLEGTTRKPLVFLSSHHQLSPEEMHGATFDVCYVPELTSKHGFASAALPSLLPPVEIDTDNGRVRLVDGGISQNIPVDPAVRLGAHRIIIIDISGRTWWFDRYGEPHDTRPSWEVPADDHTFCMRPPATLTIKNTSALGPFLKQAVGSSRRRFMDACGALWPFFILVKNKLGEDLAYEVMSYVALDPEYLNALLEVGYHDTMALIRHRGHNLFVEHEDENVALPVEPVIA